MKRIVICCDGTWNTPDKNEDSIPVPTNVVKIAQSTKHVSTDGTTQLMYYDSGVGTSGGWLKRIIDGATGSGLSQNILEAYRYLILNYDVGDQLFFFGFSRGAFTVRSLVGLIRNSGLLRSNAVDMVDRAFTLYRARTFSTHPKEIEATLFRRTYAVADITPIKFIGVWDTVGALGNPLLLKSISGRCNRFHDTRLSSAVEQAYQALAIDEKRHHFRATMWHQQPHDQNRNLEQVWFTGAHSNIGGGLKSTGLSDIALEWMTEKARHCGLDFHAVATKSDSLQPYEESRKGFYRLIPKFYRPIAKSDSQKGETNESEHSLVRERYRKDITYRSQNLEDYYVRFPDLRPNL
ncbi:hypothetical protein CEE37_05980 [candidate division LCP-89 bacterium B3_LCP]|uniref:T6SS Phospholipase effector Tle1-like catalytic domain-containing protein n=1 Tax=candidate division LCP-89 bacterium B3_LCP TaxID=2012998 RepID=A0A532V1X2_UNCL8|nr:MAG: hypothetical protein CEE37_05980 [candidate division LCP-89 bacterium B3_LCP]